MFLGPMNILVLFFFFFNDTATTEIYTLSLHDALPIWVYWHDYSLLVEFEVERTLLNGIRKYLVRDMKAFIFLDRKSTRLNSSHANISYAVFCLKKKKNKDIVRPMSGTDDIG